jgi:LmbE family N-acetylglucosaminyl deacetylase
MYFLVEISRYEDAATVFLRWGQAADKCKAVQSQCKAYLSAIIVYLFADNFNLADASYNDCSQMDSFFKSDQNHCAVQLLSAYREGRPDEIKHVVSTSSVIPHLDHMVTLLSALCHVASLDCITQLDGKHWWTKQEKM